MTLRVVVLTKMAIEDRKGACAFALVFATGLACLILFVPRSVKSGSEADEAAAARHEYTERVATKYNYRFGKEFPFVPSNATTDIGESWIPRFFLRQSIAVIVIRRTISNGGSRLTMLGHFPVR
jgi:hypothetical protein